MKRKAFIKEFGAIGLGIIAAGMLPSCSKKSEDTTSSSQNNGNNQGIDFHLDLDDPANSALGTTGGYLYKTVSGISIVIINMGGNVFNALSRICPHASCLVNYDGNTKKLPCPCHGSKFDINGTVLDGPATEPLSKYHTSLNGALLHVFE